MTQFHDLKWKEFFFDKVQYQQRFVTPNVSPKSKRVFSEYQKIYRKNNLQPLKVDSSHIKGQNKLVNINLNQHQKFIKTRNYYPNGNNTKDQFFSILKSSDNKQFDAATQEQYDHYDFMIEVQKQRIQNKMKLQSRLKVRNLQNNIIQMFSKELYDKFIEKASNNNDSSSFFITDQDIGIQSKQQFQELKSQCYMKTRIHFEKIRSRRNSHLVKLEHKTPNIFKEVNHFEFDEISKWFKK